MGMYLLMFAAVIFKAYLSLWGFNRCSFGLALFSYFVWVGLFLWHGLLSPRRPFLSHEILSPADVSADLLRYTVISAFLVSYALFPLMRSPLFQSPAPRVS